MRRRLGMVPAEAREVLATWPELTEADLEEWLALPKTRPKLLEGVKSVPGYLRALVTRYGSIGRASLSERNGGEAKGLAEAAIAKRNHETLAAVLAPRQVASREEVQSAFESSAWWRAREARKATAGVPA